MNTFLSQGSKNNNERKEMKKEKKENKIRKKKTNFDNYNIIAFPTYAYDRRRF